MIDILIADDSPVDRRIIKVILQNHLEKINFLEADNGQKVLEQVALHNVMVCIMDVMMPEKNGIEVLKELKNEEEYRDIPVILYSGLEDEEIIAQALRLGAYDYFTKPLSKKEISIMLPLKVKNAIELMNRNQEIMYLSYHDSLTGLYNRRYIKEETKRLDHTVNYPLALILGDVNGLKLTNDKFGHEIGDVLLITIADILMKECGNGVVGRTGGDEFIILLPKTEEEKAYEILEMIKKHCDACFIEQVRPDIALGCSVKTEKEQVFGDIYKVAEKRMYLDKYQKK